MSHHSINPYEPPNAAMGGAATHDARIHIEGDCLKVPREGTVLAPRCVKCNEPGAGELVRSLYWHTPWLYVMVVFPGVLFYALVAMVVRKKAFVVTVFAPPVGLVMARVLDARRMDDTHVWLRVGAPFLASHRR